jgi:hypothetical protein
MWQRTMVQGLLHRHHILMQFQQGCKERPQHSSTMYQPSKKANPAHHTSMAAV